MCKVIAIANQKGGVGRDHHNKQFRNRTGKTGKESFTDRCRCTGQSYGKSWYSGSRTDWKLHLQPLWHPLSMMRK